MKPGFLCRTACVLSLLLLICGSAQAIPPPWLIEGAKAKADLILIAGMRKPEPLKGVRGVNARIGFTAIRVLKGRLKAADGAAAVTHFILFHKPAARRGARGVERRIIGGTGFPKPEKGDTALVFLKKHPRAKGFVVCCGSFGYVRLKTDTNEGLAATRRRIHGYMQVCARIRDIEVRKAMQGFYQETLAFVDLEGMKKERRENASPRK